MPIKTTQVIDCKWKRKIASNTLSERSSLAAIVVNLHVTGHFVGGLIRYPVGSVGVLYIY